MRVDCHRHLVHIGRLHPSHDCVDQLVNIRAITDSIAIEITRIDLQFERPPIQSSIRNAVVGISPLVPNSTERFHNLALAVARAGPNDVLEIEGAYRSNSIHLGTKLLTIRAAAGATPIIILQEEQMLPLLSTEASLTLAGLDLRTANAHMSLPEHPCGLIESRHAKSLMVVRQGHPHHAI